MDSRIMTCGELGERNNLLDQADGIGFYSTMDLSSLFNWSKQKKRKLQGKKGGSASSDELSSNLNTQQTVTLLILF